MVTHHWLVSGGRVWRVKRSQHLSPDTNQRYTDARDMPTRNQTHAIRTILEGFLKFFFGFVIFGSSHGQHCTSSRRIGPLYWQTAPRSTRWRTGAWCRSYPAEICISYSTFHIPRSILKSPTPSQFTFKPQSRITHSHSTKISSHPTHECELSLHKNAANCHFCYCRNTSPAVHKPLYAIAKAKVEQKLQKLSFSKS